MLTGESVPQVKEAVDGGGYREDERLDLEDSAHKRHVIFGGTVVVDHKTFSNDSSSCKTSSYHPSIPSPAPDGGCLCYVLRTGFSTSQGSLLRTMAYNTSEPSANTVDTFVFIGLLLCFAVYTASTVVRVGLEDEHRNRFKLMLHTIIIVTSVVPPELPMEVSGCLAASISFLPFCFVCSSSDLPPFFLVALSCCFQCVHLFYSSLLFSPLLSSSLLLSFLQLALAVTNSLKSLMDKAIFCTEPFRVPLGGRIDVCCFDKTGTLTSDEMILRGVIIPVKDQVNGGSGSSGNKDSLKDSLKDSPKDSPDSTLTSPLAATDASIPRSTSRILAACHSLAISDGALIGDPLEKAVMSAVRWTTKGENSVVPLDANATASSDDSSTNSSTNSSSIHIVKRFAFSSALARMSVVATSTDSGKQASSQLALLTKGSPEMIKPLLDPATVPKHFDVIAKLHMSKGRRVLALASRDLDKSFAEIKDEKRENLEKNLRFAGFLVLDCPVKNDTVAVIAELVASRHRCVMITGDAVLTAAEVARKVGIVTAKSDRTLELQKKKTGKEEEEGESSFSWHSMEGDGGEPIPFSIHGASSSKDLEKLCKEGYELCVEGSVLESVSAAAAASSSSSSSSSSSRDGEDEKEEEKSSSKLKNSMLSASSLGALSRLVPHVSVFARHAPRHKEAVVAALNKANSFTLMCGDGTNDVGALKQAHVGISLISVPEIEKKRREALDGVRLLQKAEKLSRKLEKAAKAGDLQKVAELEKQQKKAEKKTRGGGPTNASIKVKMKEADEELSFVSLGDASVASPFTYRGTSIDCCKQVILQGRCTLVIMLQIYKILGVNCLVTALILSR